MSCRLNRLRLWQGRLLLEAQEHPSSLFVTLTYSPENLPHKGWLVPRDMQLFLKRLRRFHARPVRFFGVGEYGEQTWRPHYHLALFGDFNTFVDESFRLRCSVISKAWTLGHVHVGLLTPASAAYLTRYTLKRLVKDGDPLLEGRRPEFARMSRRPGLGRSAADNAVRAYTETRQGSALLAVSGDVPGDFIYQGRRYTWGRYLTRYMRSELGRPAGQPDAVSLARSAEICAQDPKQRETVRVHHSRVAEQRVNNRRLKGDL